MQQLNKHNKNEQHFDVDDSSWRQIIKWKMQGIEHYVLSDTIYVK